MKRLLILTPRFPYPVIGGDRLRIYQVCKALSERFSLTLLSLCESDVEMEMPVPEDGVFDRVERVLLTRQRSYFNSLLALAGRMPLQIAYYRSAAFARAVDRLLPEHDGVLSHLIRCGEYVRNANKPRILEMTDAISLNYERVRNLKQAGGFKGRVYRLESGRLLAYERQIIEDFDLSILVSETDKEFLVGPHHDRVLVCSNGVDLQHLPFKERSGSRPVIVYIGNMASIQNMDACLYFARDVMPLVAQCLNATFRVVGKISDADAARLRAFQNVEVTGPVEDMAQAVADARLGVCPVRLAAGVQNKVLEYMALGLPVVTSQIGLEGFAAQPGIDLLVANTPEEYVVEIERLWNNSAMASTLASNGRSYVERHHQWANRLAPMVEKVSILLNGK
jgi:glycosyltransferase involved in cell wall biosynthesis